MKKFLILFFLLSACNPRAEGDLASSLISILGIAFVAAILWISGPIIDFFTNPKDKNYQIKPNINKNKETDYSKKNRRKLLEELADDKRKGDSLEDGYNFKTNVNIKDKNADTEYAKINRENFLKELAEDKRKGNKVAKERD
tara:strand:- start:70 stop:495 length:426 start_codon:yes stop_codon:yes gene_type:complete